MRCTLIVPDGLGVRNFLLGRFPEEARARGELHVLHSVPDGLLPTYAGRAAKAVEWRPLVPYRERPSEHILSELLYLAHMHWADTRAMRHNRNLPARGSWRARAIRRAGVLAARAVATPRAMRMLDRWHRSAVARLQVVDHYRRLFQSTEPSVVFSSHQRPLEVLPPVLAAKVLGIPTATFIFSWDNLTSKGRFAAPFDHYLVWSDLMREELVRYYPDVSVDRVHVVGTPQFDPYADESLIVRREIFFGQIGADPSRPLLCFSASDGDACREDSQQVAALLELVRGRRIRGEPQILLRVSPGDVDERRFDDVKRTYPELLLARPAWIRDGNDGWSRSMPLPEDVALLANLTHHADLNINVASTMTLDFAIRDKPVVNIAFDLADPPSLGAPLWEVYYQFEHYRPVIECGAVRCARSPQQLAGHINAYLEDPRLDAEGRRRLVDLQVSRPLGQSSRRIANVLAGIAR